MSNYTAPLKNNTTRSKKTYKIKKGGRKMSVVLTSHALDRLSEIGVSPENAVNQLKSSRRVKKKIGRQAYKASLYGDGSNNIEYWYNSPLLYTVAPKHNRLEEIQIVVTVTERREGKFLKKNKLTRNFL